MELITLKSFIDYYKQNRDKINVNFTKPIWDKGLVGRRDYNKISEAMIGGVIFSSRISSNNHLYEGVTDGLFESIKPLISLKDYEFYNEEVIYDFNSFRGKGTVATIINRNSYSGHDFKVISFGVIYNHPLVENKSAVVLQVTFNLWNLITQSLFEMANHNNVYVNFTGGDNSFYLIKLNTSKVSCIMRNTKELVFDILIES